MKSIWIILIVASLIVLISLTLLLLNSRHYKRFNIYQIKGSTQEGKIFMIVKPDKLLDIFEDITKSFSLASKQENIKTKINYRSGKSGNKFSTETFNKSDVQNYLKIILTHHDGELDIVGHNIGFGLYDQDFVVYYLPTNENQEKLISILKKNGLVEKGYAIKSKYPHFHIEIFSMTELEKYENKLSKTMKKRNA